MEFTKTKHLSIKRILVSLDWWLVQAGHVYMPFYSIDQYSVHRGLHITLGYTLQRVLISQGSIIHRVPYYTGFRITQSSILDRVTYYTEFHISQGSILHSTPYYSEFHITVASI